MTDCIGRLSCAFFICHLLLMQAGLSWGASDPETSGRPPAPADRELFVRRAGELWGTHDVWEPSATVWVQYEPDLGERSAVDFETGTVQVELLTDPEEDPHGQAVRAHLRQGIRNLIRGKAEDPVEMVVLDEQKKRGADAGGRTGQPYASHNLGLGYKRVASPGRPLLLDQIRRPDGTKVSGKDIDAFIEDVVTIKNVSKKRIVGSDGVSRQAVTVTFKLAPNHLEIRARKFYPLVKDAALRYGLDPSLIMGIIHTESMFNPRARSRTPAFGLMQLVPDTGAREAYSELYGVPKSPSAKYLYDPRNNIELGIAYFDILRNRYMAAIDEPESRTYCAVAAYNAGAANVGRAFISDRSVVKAAPVINTLSPTTVYERLVTNLHRKESRSYIRKVLTRSVLYASWN